MKASVLKGTFRPDRLENVVDIIRREVMPALGRISGFRDAEFWVNRQTGECINVGTYESEEAREAAGSLVRETLTRLTEHLEGQLPQREFFDLAAATALEERALVERSIEAFNRGDLEQYARDLAPDVEWGGTMGGERRGPQAVKEFAQEMHRAFPDVHVEVGRIHAVSHTVVVEADLSGTHAGALGTSTGEIPPTGRRFVEPSVQVYTVDRGLISRVRFLYDRMSLMAQLGAAPGRIEASP